VDLGSEQGGRTELVRGGGDQLGGRHVGDARQRVVGLNQGATPVGPAAGMRT
jgi:hypothetical protein